MYKNNILSNYKKKVSLLFGKNNKPKSKLLKIKKTFIYNNNNCNFVIKKKEIIIAKNYKNIYKKPHVILKKIKNVLWNILYIFKLKNKKKRRKARHLRFKLRMLNKYLYFKKHSYRKKKLYKKLIKNFKIKKVKIKLENGKTKKVIIKTSKKKKTLKIKRLIKIIKKAKKQNNKNLRLIQNFLHGIKRETLSVNTIIKRKQKRKIFWLTYLYFTKKDIKNAFCLRLLHKPLAFKKLLTLQQK